MKKLLIISLFVLIAADSFGTAQMPDRIIFNGDTLLLHYCPLTSYPKEGWINPGNLFGSKGCFYTACWRNYIATWEIIGNELYLNEIRNACYPGPITGVSVSYKGGIDQNNMGREYADLKSLFPERYQNGKVKADWVSGMMFAPRGKLLYYIHDGFESIYEKEQEFTFENGILKNARELDNSKTKRSKYRDNEKLMLSFIASHINRENLPVSDSMKRKVYVTIVSADDNGKIDSLRIVKGVNGQYDKEALRVMSLIPEWEVIYRHGRKDHFIWTFPVMFDLTGKK